MTEPDPELGRQRRLRKLGEQLLAHGGFGFWESLDTDPRRAPRRRCGRIGPPKPGRTLNWAGNVEDRAATISALLALPRPVANCGGSPWGKWGNRGVALG